MSTGELFLASFLSWEEGLLGVALQGGQEVVQGQQGEGHTVTAQLDLHTGRRRHPKSKPDTQPREAGESSAA